ncbi:N-acetylmuramoyl-L-alanine amidase [Bacillus sp. Marseille-P3661]|uniref:N-acetylmuramoyl-L-alanine amidase n=1 Tax=Bacillus sp. Marseille-P3661 TaxID=1936234 RepID=UPI000C820FD7|nr:N-acetylmuramoyl-L-alanine amidase [Bacillus sp. Marseille-P3661]
MTKKSFLTFIICTFAIVFIYLGIPLQTASANELGLITTDDLNVRTAPSTQGEILGKIHTGTEVEILEKTGEWYKISSNLGDGFVHSSYVNIHTSTNKTSNTSTATSSSSKVKVYVNGELLQLPIEPPITDGRVLVPFRGISEALGIQVNWLNATRQVEAIDNGKYVLFTIGKQKVQVGNETLNLVPAARIEKEYTVLPLRFFAESFGADVRWIDSTRTVEINRGESISNENEEATSPNTSGSLTLALIEDADVGVYEEPNSKSKKLGSLQQGDTIKAYAASLSKNDEWLEIQYKNESAYIKSDSIRSQQSTIKGTVNATALNVRKYADSESDIVDRLSKGQEVIVYEFDGQWARFKTNGKWGYVHSYYLTLKKNNKSYVALGSPTFENNGNRSLLTWSKVGAVTTSHKLISGGVEISSNATTVDEWSSNHPAVKRIEYASGSKIRIYFNPGYHFVVRHSNNDVKITLLESGLTGKRIVIDAGHGAHDPGAVGVTGLNEKTVNLVVAQKLANLLQDAGAEVTMTRNSDTFLALSERVAIAHRNDADAFISLHADSFKATSQGSTTFYHSGKNPSWQQSKQLSDITIKKIVAALGTVNRGSNDKSLHVIRETEIPAILVELAFLSNPTEEAMLKSDESRQKAAQAIYESFVEFYN